MEILKKDINFVELQKLMEDKGYKYSSESRAGTYDSRFLYEFAEGMGLDIIFEEKEKE